MAGAKQKMSVLAVVPARGGSKGILRKNLCPLEGKPLVEHALRAGLSATRVTDVVLSTDDAEIAAVGERLGTEVIKRPAEIATDEATTISVLRHVLDHLSASERTFDALVLLEPTSPFRTPEIIDHCIELLAEGACATVLTVTQLERNPRYIFSVEGNDAQFYIKSPETRFKRRQEFLRLKRLNGCVYAVRPQNVIDGDLVAAPIKVVEMLPEASINIDTPLDLEIAGLVSKSLVSRGLWAA